MSIKEKVELNLLFEKKTKYQDLKFYNNEDKNLVFTIDTFIQFVEGQDEVAYHRALVDSAWEMKPTAKEYLILGGGDGLVARNIFQLNPQAKITIVEIDEDVINLFKNTPRLYKLNKSSLFNCDIIIKDALLWVEEVLNKKWDIIILDFPDNNSKELAKLYEKDFYKKVIRLLNENGVISIQCHSDIGEKIYKIIKSLLPKVKIIDYKMPFLIGGEIIIGTYT